MRSYGRHLLYYCTATTAQEYCADSNIRHQLSISQIIRQQSGYSPAHTIIGSFRRSAYHFFIFLYSRLESLYGLSQRNRIQDLNDTWDQMYTFQLVQRNRYLYIDVDRQTTAHLIMRHLQQ